MTSAITGDVSWLRSDVTRDNNFDLLRLLAALQVVILHAAGHMNVWIPSWFFTGMDYVQGVPIFFFLSGMLVTQSLSTSVTVRAFYVKRCRRIFPALWAAFGIALLLLIGFGQITAQVVKLPAFWLWVGTQLSFLQFYNPPFFRHFGTGVVNGSLWTISVEIGFYLVLPFIVAAARRLGAKRANQRSVLEAILIPSVILSWMFSTYLRTLGAYAGESGKAPLWALLANQTFVPHFWLFGLGILAYLRFDYFKQRLPSWSVLLSSYLLISIAGTWLNLPRYPLFLLAGRLVLCATVLACGAYARPIANRILKGWDLSYSVYVFHMLVLNTFIALHIQGSWGFVILVIGLALGMAALSWKFIEKPSLKRGSPQAQPSGWTRVLAAKGAAAADASGML
jgi:peptidoglycan/LPS O-acetylase OafA/YrhL